jgi:starch phosphorylase
MNNERKIAYFSMEIGLDVGIPTYSGGLGILAGDTIRSAADLAVPMVAMTLLYRKGHLYQRLDANGWQSEEPMEWTPNDYLKEAKARASVTLEGRTVAVRAWKYEVTGFGGFSVPVYFLDTDLPENSEQDRTLSHFLYGGDSRYRFCQEVILGIGGVKMLRALGYDNIERFHMNEGHASLLTLELLDESINKKNEKVISESDIDSVRKKCVFTTHTPVAAGHDKFPMDMVTRIIGEHEAFNLKNVFCCDNELNMTYLALNLSHYVNGVAKKHGEVTRHMFAPYIIDSITNGIHAATWASPPFQTLFDQFIPGWREDNFNLRYALNIPKEKIWQAHTAAKQNLIQYVNRVCNSGMDFDVLTFGFARRAASYKRADLLFEDIDKLRQISSQVGPIQIIYAGKAHPQDQGGKELIHKIFQAKKLLKPQVKIAYLANYDIELGKMITAGVDVWLNTPLPPLEASGTSGMKAALNGVPSLSILDGWWIEGCIENVTGWAIGQYLEEPNVDQRRTNDSLLLYEKLEHTVVPGFYHNRDSFINVMKHCIALNGSFFNTQRMMNQYVLKAYFP